MVTPLSKAGNTNEAIVRGKSAKRILTKLGLGESHMTNMHIVNSTAKKVLESQFSIAEMGNLFPQPAPLFDDIKV